MKHLYFFLFLSLPFSLCAQNWTVGGKISVCKGDPVTISSPINNATNYIWSTGDLTQSITVTPLVNTTYKVTVLYNGNILVDSSVVHILTVDAGANDTICGGETVYFNASGGIFYNWFPTEGLMFTEGQYNAVTTDTNVTYYCDITAAGPNIIFNGDFELGNVGFTSFYTYNATSLWNESTYMVGLSPQTYHPNFFTCPDHTSGSGKQMIVNGAVTPNITIWQQNIQIVPNTNYIFSCWVQNVGPDANLAQLQFRINGNLIGPVFLSSDTICHWTQFYTLWNSNSNSSAVISIVNQNIGGGGNDFALDDIFFSELKVCTDSVQVFVQNPSMNLGPDTTICEGQYFYLQPQEPYTNYYWSTGASSPSIMVLVEGAYWCQGTNASDCIATDTINVFFKPQPRLEIFARKNPICEGESTQIIVESSTTPIFLLWDNGELSDSITVKPTSNTLYSVIGNADDCVDTAQIEIEVIPYQTIELGEDDFLCSGQSIFFNLDTITGDFLWSNDETINQLLIEEPGIYWVYINDRGCELSDTIEFKACSEIKIPNIFTPNGDFINDFFYPETQGIDTLTIWIYDRWGKNVFKTDDFKTGWDGKISGSPAPEGQYYWTIYYIENRSGNLRKERDLHGTVILAR
ncbi:MAG TPA: gliding motility-associated C-terminal domain-containing protein [Bacteroidales bacterium]|jgi:gliding motility-associated-like protein|nr:gliding motility-associated C-terminal domain-containing protein [Bacteroidales bacterium]HPE41095.1 gliding motility-associated C-terminal domain-containing protein [Bacteroidales bacterium]